MKLIIDIPDNVYIACNEYKDNTNIGILQRILYIAIFNGIPLDDFLKRRKEPIDKDVLKSYLKERTMPNSLKSRLKNFAHQGLLSEKDLSRIYTNNDVVTELEKIKAEIEELKSDSDYYEWYGIKRTVNLIDKHISELKGE